MFQALLGPALSFGSSLISGLGARSSAKKQAKIQAAYEYQNSLIQERVNNQRSNIGQNIVAAAAEIAARWSPANIARDADAAGFNPVTWAYSMGGTYGAMQQAALQYRQYGDSLQIEVPYFQNAPTAQVPSTMEAVGGALQAGVNTFLSDRRTAQSQDFQREMLGVQLAAIERNRGRPSSAIGVPDAQRTFFGSGQIPYSVTSGALRAGARAPGLSGVTDGGVNPLSWKPGDVEVTNPYPVGGYIDPTRPNISAMEDRYGDDHPIPWIAAWQTGWADLRATWRGHSARDAIQPDYLGHTENPYYPDGARGLSWGRPDTSYNGGLFPGFGYSTGGRF